MPLYVARVLGPDMHITEIREEAKDQASLEKSLAAHGSTLVSARLLSKRGAISGARLAPRRLEEFTDLLATLMEAGLSLRDSLGVVADTAMHPEVKSLAEKLAYKLDSGRTLADAFADYGVRLPPVYLGLLRIGERIGGLEGIFPRLSAHLSTSRKAKDKLTGALVYPIIVISLALVGLIGLSVFILPRLTIAFSELGGTSYTVLAKRIGIVSTIGGIAFSLAAISFAIWPFVTHLRKSDERFGLVFDSALLSLPLIGAMLTEKETLDFTFAMEVLVGGGLPVDEALAESARAARNRSFATDIEIVRKAVRKGMRLSVASAQARHFPVYLRQWFALGERTGNVERVFTQLRVYYQSRTDRTLERLISLAEPVIMLVVGAIIIFMVVFLILPIFSAYGSML